MKNNKKKKKKQNKNINLIFLCIFVSSPKKHKEFCGIIETNIFWGKKLAETALLISKKEKNETIPSKKARQTQKIISFSLDSL